VHPSLCVWQTQNKIMSGIQAFLKTKFNCLGVEGFPCLLGSGWVKVCVWVVRILTGGWAVRDPKVHPPLPIVQEMGFAFFKALRIFGVGPQYTKYMVPSVFCPAGRRTSFFFFKKKEVRLLFFKRSACFFFVVVGILLLTDS
jgi:hypothetical protein